VVEPAVVERHESACHGFGSIVEMVGDRWFASSPCAGWSARDVLEHVIGFHDVLVLRPLGVRAHRPRDDPDGRWAATQNATLVALNQPGALSEPLTALPGAAPYRLLSLLPALTTDVLIHTWDLCARGERR
jgi:uncharacterized protein (TIGR03083 family)